MAYGSAYLLTPLHHANRVATFGPSAAWHDTVDGLPWTSVVNTGAGAQVDMTALTFAEVLSIGWYFIYVLAAEANLGFSVRHGSPLAAAAIANVFSDNGALLVDTNRVYDDAAWSGLVALKLTPFSDDDVTLTRDRITGAETDTEIAEAWPALGVELPPVSWGLEQTVAIPRASIDAPGARLPDLLLNAEGAVLTRVTLQWDMLTTAQKELIETLRIGIGRSWRPIVYIQDKAGTGTVRESEVRMYAAEEGSFAFSKNSQGDWSLSLSLLRFDRVAVGE